MSDVTESKQRVVWLIGASSGIGKSLADKLSSQSFIVAISARNSKNLNEMSALNNQLKPYPVDVTNPAELASTYDLIKQELGEVSCCIFNAGDYTPMPVEQFDRDLFRQLLDVNYMGAVNLLDVILPDWTERGHGQILLTASLAAYRGLPRSAPYSASKAALLNMAESLHLELKAKGVLLRVINPGFVRTPLTDKNNFNMPSLIEPDEAAHAIITQLDNTQFEIRFPPRFAFVMNVLRILPYRLYFWITRRTL